MLHPGFNNSFQKRNGLRLVSIKIYRVMNFEFISNSWKYFIRLSPWEFFKPEDPTTTASAIFTDLGDLTVVNGSIDEAHHNEMQKNIKFSLTRRLWCQTNPAEGLFSHALNIYGIPPLLGSLKSQLGDSTSMVELQNKNIPKIIIKTEVRESIRTWLSS